MSEGESDEDYSYMVGESGSETEDAESERSEDEDEVDLQENDANYDYGQENLFSSRPGMTWSSIASHLGKTKFSSDIIEKPEPTKFTKNIVFIDDAIFCSLSEKMLNKILIYSKKKGNRDNVSDEKWKDIALIELKAFIGLLLLVGLLGNQTKA